MSSNLFVVIYIFIKTLAYYLYSFLPNTDIHTLKQKWALSVLKTLGFKIHIDPKKFDTSNILFVGNHISYLDILVLFAANPSCVFLSKIEVSRWPIIGPAAKRIGTLFVDRSSATSRQFSKAHIESLLGKQQNYQIVGFPSGTTTLYEEKPWKKGLFEIAYRTETMVQPFRISYYPLRPCAYIDNDNLFLSLMNLMNIKSKTIFLEWGPAYKVFDVDIQLEETRLWTARRTDIKLNDLKIQIGIASF